MKRQLIKIIICNFLFIFLFTIRLDADVIHLKNGRKLEGEVIRELKSEIVVDMGSGTITFSRNEIKSIEKKDSVKNEERKIFDQRLTNLLIEAGKNAATTDKEKLKTVNKKFLEFSKEYPKNVFTDDVQAVISFIGFVAALTEKDERRCKIYTKDISILAKRYPDGNLERLTYDKLAKMVPGAGSTSFDAINMPYKYLVLYMKGMTAAISDDYEAIIENFCTIKDNLPYSAKYGKTFMFDVYPGLAMSYVKLGRLEEADKVAVEALGKFSQDEWLREYMEKIRNKTK